MHAYIKPVNGIILQKYLDSKKHTSEQHMHWTACVYPCWILRHSRPAGRSRGLEEVHSNPPLLTSKYTALTVHFRCPTVWKWSTSLAAFENHCCQNLSGCCYANFFPRRTGAERALELFTLQRWKDVCNSRVVLLVLSAHLLFCQTLIPSLMEFEVSWLRKCIHGQPKIGWNTPQAM